MNLILNIDTALVNASVCLADEGTPLAMLKNNNQKDHAAWLHQAIEELFLNTRYQLKELKAVAVSNGPGSYTGLRVGLASAKGICYALSIPLITISTMEIIAFSVKDKAEDLVVPLVDARREEVFTAVYDREIRVKNSTYAMILEPGTFGDLLDSHKIIFCGNAIEKLRKYVDHPNASFSKLEHDAGLFSPLSHMYFVKKMFADLSAAEPFYVKEFHSPFSK